MSDPNDNGNNNLVGALLPTRKLITQLAFFVVGLALLGLIINNAARQDGWDRLVHAPPLLIAALLGCTFVSAFLNGVIFWVTIRPVHHIRFWDMQRLNVVANMLNYAPVRLGAIGRVAYHWRVDGLTLLQIGAWFGFIGVTLVMGVAACLLATIVRGGIDWIWGLLVIGLVVAGAAALRFVAGNPLLVRHGRGIDRMIADRSSLWGALGLRMVDLGAFTGRMGVAAAILGIELTAAQVVVLALVALAAGLIPFGRVGFREFCVAATGNRLSAMAGDTGANIDLLALVESAGEALVFIPLGVTFLWWFRGRFKEAKSLES